jgi:hypothetical protein
MIAEKIMPQRRVHALLWSSSRAETLTWHSTVSRGRCPPINANRTSVACHTLPVALAHTKGACRFRSSGTSEGSSKGGCFEIILAWCACANCCSGLLWCLDGGEEKEGGDDVGARASAPSSRSRALYVQTSPLPLTSDVATMHSAPP